MSSVQIILELLLLMEFKIPCISARGQKVFHTGYELRDVDRHDLKIIDSLLK